MRILVVPTTDWTRHPVPNRLNFIFDRLAKRHEVYVIHFELKRFSQNPERETNCELVKVGRSLTDDLALYYVLGSAKHARIIKRVISDKDIDVIVCANVLPSFLATIVNGSIPLVFDYLDHLEESVAIYYPGNIVGKIGKLMTRLIISRALASATLITTVTKEFDKYLNSRGFSNVRVIPNGVDTKVIRPMPASQAKQKLGIDGLILGYVGSLEYWIDLETVLRSIPAISRVGLDPKILIVGPTLVTDYLQNLNELARRLGIEDRVVFCGSVPYRKLSEYVSAMDICLNPRKPLLMNLMTLGSKIFTYLACGKPVLSTNMPALERLLGPEDGVFYYNERTFVDQVVKVTHMEHNADRYRETSRAFDWDRISRRYEDALIEVLP